MRLHRFLVILAVLIVFTAHAGAQPAQRQVNIPTVQKLTLNRNAELSSILNTLRISGHTKDTALRDFPKLPEGAQDAILSALSPTYANKVGRYSNNLTIKMPDLDKLQIDFTPRITRFLPARGSDGEWIAIEGTMLTADCKAVFANQEQPSYMFLGVLCFEVPAGKVCGQNYNVKVRNTKLNKESANAQFRVVAPIGYRGVHGWRFGNFTTATLSWNIYRNYFTPTAVEYSNGTHRPSAQEWYDSAYKGVAAGGDCFGMSVRSIRTKMGQWQGIYDSWWPGNTQPTVWDYANTEPQVGDSIRQDQGGQLCAQNAAIINDRWNNQTHAQAWTFIRDSINPAFPDRQPIVGFWQGNKKGHAVVGYATSEDTNNRYISVYDNNKPYLENELNDRSSICTIQKSNNAFSYNYGNNTYADRMIALRFNEMVHNTPLLPSQATGSTAGLAAGMTIVVVEAGATVKQISDQQGRTFFAGNNLNMNPATRIPDSMQFVPLTGGDLPPNYPSIFIFNNTSGKSLSFDVDSPSVKTMRVFTPGVVTKLNIQRGRFKLDRLLMPDQNLILTNPNAMNISGVDLIAVQPDRSERVFEVRNFQNLQTGNLSLRFTPGRNGLQIENALGNALQLNLNIRGLSNSGVQQTALQGVSIPANQLGSIAVQDFRNLQTPQVQMRPR